MSIEKNLASEIEAAAKVLKIAPSTVGERAGQGGKFYRRLKEGRRVWPDTAERVRKRLDEMLRASCDTSHVPDATIRQDNCIKHHTDGASA